MRCYFLPFEGKKASIQEPKNEPLSGCHHIHGCPLSCSSFSTLSIFERKRKNIYVYIIYIYIYILIRHGCDHGQWLKLLSPQNTWLDLLSNLAVSLFHHFPINSWQCQFYDNIFLIYFHIQIIPNTKKIFHWIYHFQLVYCWIETFLLGHSGCWCAGPNRKDQQEKARNWGRFFLGLWEKRQYR